MLLLSLVFSIVLLLLLLLLLLESVVEGEGLAALCLAREASVVVALHLPAPVSACNRGHAQQSPGRKGIRESRRCSAMWERREGANTRRWSLETSGA
jgi:hypothetical protein